MFGFDSHTLPPYLFNLSEVTEKRVGNKGETVRYLCLKFVKRRAKPWKGEGAGVFEVVEDHRGDTYRAAYTVRFEGAVYVLHAFQKKSPSGIKTAQADVGLIAQRLKLARQDYEARYGKAK